MRALMFVLALGMLAQAQTIATNPQALGDCYINGTSLVSPGDFVRHLYVTQGATFAECNERNGFWHRAEIKPHQPAVIGAKCEQLAVITIDFTADGRGVWCDGVYDSSHTNYGVWVDASKPEPMDVPAVTEWVCDWSYPEGGHAKMCEQDTCPDKRRVGPWYSGDGKSHCILFPKE